MNTTILPCPTERKPILRAEYTAVRAPRHAQPPTPWAVGDRVIHTERRRGGFSRKLRGTIVKIGKVNITIEYDLLGSAGQVRATARKGVNPGTLARVLATPFIDEVSIDIAAKLGQDDATEGNGHVPEDWITGNQYCLASYDAAYLAGLALVDPSSGEQSEGEFMAETLSAVRAGVFKAMTRLTAEQLEDIEAERPGLYEFCNRGSW